jgi:predicted permease
MSWKRLFRREKWDEERARELQAHVQIETDENVSRGMTPDEARYAAQRKLGNATSIREEIFHMNSVGFVETLWQDVRYGMRMLGKNPGFAAVAILTLALGIGVNTAIFSLLDAILLRTLPVSHPESLVVLASCSRDSRVGDFGYQDYLKLRDGNEAFAGILAASSQDHVDVETGADNEAALRKIVSANYFSVLGVQPALGRGFSDDEDNQPVAVISNAFWNRSFSGSSAVIGKQIDLDGSAFTVVGVAPAEFTGETVGEAPDIWATISLMPAPRRSMPGYTWLNLMGRLKPSVHTQQASADLSRLVSQLPDSESQGGFITRVAVESGDRGSSGLRDTFSVPLNVLMTVVAIVLLVACANLASLQLARAATRQREIATRLALGAGRGRIVRQLLTESVMLALAGGAMGLLFALWTERFLLNLVAGAGRAITIDVSPNIHALGFTAAISIVTGVLFGLAPALQAARQGGVGLIHNSQFRVGRSHRWLLKDVLIAAQVALSVLLLIVGGLFVRTLENLKTQDIGFQATNVLSLQIASESGHQPVSANQIALLLQSVNAIPSVRVSSFSFNPTLAMDGSGVQGLKFDGDSTSTHNQHVRANWVGPNYFATSGIPLTEGRDFSPTDNSNAQKTAILNQTIARHYFGDRSAIGKRFEFGGQQYTIIGVAKDAKYIDLRASNVPFVYFASLQSNSEIHSLELRTTASPLALASAVRDAIRNLDPHLKVREITTLQNRIDQHLAREILAADVAGFFSALTLVIIFVGIYGTLAYTVARRTNEIGIRMALGARRRDVLQLVIGQGLILTFAGLALGIVAALGLTRFLASLLYGVKPSDALTFVAVSLTVIGVALLASYIPARRATQVDPMVALRNE